MAFLTIEELSTHLYGEVMDEISRSDNDKPQEAIDAAIEEAGSYLRDAYDVAATFAATGNQRNPVLLLYVKDIAVWHFIQLSNVSVEMQLRLDRYEKAVEYLKRVQNGKANPNLPIPAPPTSNDNWVKWGSNPRRGTHY